MWLSSALMVMIRFLYVFAFHAEIEENIKIEKDKEIKILLITA